MKRNLLQICLTIFASMLWAPASAQEETFTEPLSQISFPKKITFQYQDSTRTLTATGAAERKHAKRGKKKGEQEFRSVCTVAHYMEHPPNGDAQKIYGLILESKNLKVFVMNFNTRIPAGKIKEWFLGQTERKDPAAKKKILKSLNEFADLFAGEFMQNERCEIRWLPDGGTMVLLPGAPEKIIADPAFAPFWWKLWLGEGSSFERSDLVNRIVSL